MLKWVNAIVLAIVVGLGAAYHFKEINELKAEHTQQLQAAKDAAEKAEKDIEDQSAQLIKEKDEKISSLNGRVNALTRSLQQRAKRDSSVNLPPQVGETCTGAQLFREDGEFLAGEAARADQLAIERDFYYEQYEQARKRIDEFNRAK